jgi:aldehyde dehydrogenase (NAD+)
VLTTKIHEPVGVVVAAPPSSQALLGLVSVLAPALSRGNCVVAAPAAAAAGVAALLYAPLTEAIAANLLPAGAVAVVAASQVGVVKAAVTSSSVQSVWYFGGDATIGAAVEFDSAAQLLRTWVDYPSAPRDWTLSTQGQGEEFLLRATEVKNIWITIGECHQSK